LQLRVAAIFAMPSPAKHLAFALQPKIRGFMSTQVSGGEHIEQVVERVHNELDSLLKQRAAITKRIGTIKQTILGLADLFGDDVVSGELLELVDPRPSSRQAGFTKTCRIVLMESGHALLTREVCEEIKGRNPALIARQKDPLASVSTVLNRLASYGEVRFLANDRGRRAWQWVTENSDQQLPPLSADFAAGVKMKISK
jgi:hypothetical protein